MSHWGVMLSAVLLCVSVTAIAAEPIKTKPTVWIYPPIQDEGRCLRELFEQPDAWKDTRSLINVLGYTDYVLDKQFTDEQLKAYFATLKRWGIKFAMEAGAVKPWGQTGEKSFAVARPMWDRFQRLGADIYAVAFDEPLCCARKEINKPDDYAVQETANFIALVRKTYPKMLVGDIEPYPFIPLADQMKWIDALEKRLAEMNVKGMDFYRLDVNWAEFTVFDRGNWQEVRKLEQFCRARNIPFSLIYWASDYPSMKQKGIADDANWYVSVLRQGYDYTMVDGAPDQFVIESWIEAPARCVPDSAEFSFTRSVRDFCRKFVKSK